MHVHHSWKVFLAGGKPIEASHDGRGTLEISDGVKNVSKGQAIFFPFADDSGLNRLCSRVISCPQNVEILWGAL